MKNEATLPIERGTEKLVDAQTLLDLLFDERARPCLRSLRAWTANQIVPCIRCGGLIFYDVEQVRAALARRAVKSKT